MLRGFTSLYCPFLALFVCLFDISLFSQVFDSPDENNSVHSPTRRYIVAANLVTLKVGDKYMYPGSCSSVTL